MRLRGLRGEGAALAALLVIAAVIYVAPLGLLARTALFEGGAPTAAPVLEALGDPSVRRAAWHSLESASLSGLIALTIGTAMALALGLTDIRGKGVFVFLLLLPMMIPPQVTAIAWLQALGPGSPLLKALGLAPPPGTAHPLHSREGIIALLSLQHTPLVLLVVLAGLRALPREMSDSARVAGAGARRLIGRIILPLIAPGLIAAGALAFVSALGNFGIPAILGIPARYATLPVIVWRRLAAFGPDILQGVAAIAILLAVIAVAALAVQVVVQRRAGAALIGPPQPPLRIALGPARPLVEGVVALYLAATLIFPIAALFATALVGTFGVPLTLETLTLDNFAEILLHQAVTLRAFANSTFAAGTASALLAVMAGLVAYFLSGRRPQIQRRGAGAIAALGDLGYAIPGIVISIAFILAFIRPLPLIDVSVYNTIWIILLAYLAAFFSIALKPAVAAFGQIDPALEDAARVSGAGFARRMRRIFAPLVAPSAASGAILVFLTAYNEITVSALLWSTGNETIGTTIFNYEDGGYTALASAMSAVTVIVTAALMLVLDRAGRRLPAGVVPWRL